MTIPSKINLTILINNNLIYTVFWWLLSHQTTACDCRLFIVLTIKNEDIKRTINLPKFLLLVNATMNRNNCARKNICDYSCIPLLRNKTAIEKSATTKKKIFANAQISAWSLRNYIICPGGELSYNSSTERAFRSTNATEAINQ